MHCKSVRVICYAKWELSRWTGGIYHIMPIAADTGGGLGGFNPPPLQCVAVRKRGSYWSPPPPLSSSDFSALNGVLHYTRDSRSSLVQGLGLGLVIMHSPTHLLLSPSQHLSICTLHFVGLVPFLMDLQMIFDLIKWKIN